MGSVQSDVGRSAAIVEAASWRNCSMTSSVGMVKYMPLTLLECVEAAVADYRFIQRSLDGRLADSFYSVTNNARTLCQDSLSSGPTSRIVFVARSAGTTLRCVLDG